MSENTNEIWGRGWKFPPAFDKNVKGTVMVEGEQNVAESIHVILHTKLNERIMRPEFGSTLHDLLFEPLNANLKTYMGSSLKRSLDDEEPRISVDQLTLEQTDPALGRVDIKIVYTLIETNETRNLVVPFYTADNTNLS